MELKAISLGKQYRNSTLGLKKEAEHVQALNNFTYTFSRGLYGILGPNGAGKTTLIHLLTSNLLPTSGRITWNGKALQKWGKRYRALLGYMPQQQQLYNSFTGRQFLLYICALKEIPKKDMSDEVSRVAQHVNMNVELDKKISAYSGGMKQRLLAAAAFLGTPKVLILDEPTAGFDPKERVRFRELVAKMAQESIVILATHVVQDIEDVANKVLLLKQGELVDAASPKQLVKKYESCNRLEDVYMSVFREEE